MEVPTMAKQWLFIGSLLVLMLVSLAITVTAETLPDLAVKDVYTNSDGMLIVDQVNNGAAVNTLNGQTYIWIDGQLKWTYSWKTLEVSRQAFLQANGASSINPQILSGVHKVEACVDAQNIIPESDESNNCIAIRVDAEHKNNVSQKPIGKRWLSTFINNLRGDLKDERHEQNKKHGEIISEEVKCVLANAAPGTSQGCGVASNPEDMYHGAGCTAVTDESGAATCVVEVKAQEGEKLTWKSSCGGYAYTVVDGGNEYASFNCADLPARLPSMPEDVDLNDIINLPDEMYAAYATEGDAGVDTQLVDKANLPVDIAVRFARPTASTFVALVCAKGEDLGKLDVEFKANEHTDMVHVEESISAGTCVKVKSSDYEAFGLKSENIKELKQFSVLADAGNNYKERNERNNYFHLNMEAFRKFIHDAREKMHGKNKELHKEVKSSIASIRPEVKEKIKARLEEKDFDEKLYTRVLTEKSNLQRVAEEVSVRPSTQEFADKCSGGQCETPKNSCVNVGVRLLGEDKQLLYCDLSGELMQQKNINEACMNSYECTTNSCNSSVCTDLVQELKETRSLLQRVNNWLDKLFG